MSVTVVSTYPVHPAALADVDDTEYADKQRGAESLVYDRAEEVGMTTGVWWSRIRWMTEAEAGGTLVEWTPGTPVPDGALTLHCQAVTP